MRTALAKSCHSLVPLSSLLQLQQYHDLMDYQPNPPYFGTGAKVPPAYHEASQPLLGNSSRSAIYHQPGPREIPDDFMVG